MPADTALTVRVVPPVDSAVRTPDGSDVDLAVKVYCPSAGGAVAFLIMKLDYIRNLCIVWGPSEHPTEFGWWRSIFLPLGSTTKTELRSARVTLPRHIISGGGEVFERKSRPVVRDGDFNLRSDCHRARDGVGDCEVGKRVAGICRRLAQR